MNQCERKNRDWRIIMNRKPVLVVMAAGMGSRYGGLKQIDPVGSHGQAIMDYSIYDARRAGFETVVFVIKQAIAEEFREAIGRRIEKVMQVHYVYQELTDIPAGFTVPEGRVKPWGTTHAVLAARNVVDGPFAVINADDYYGPEAFKTIFDFLSNHTDSENCYEFAMVGYRLGNTLTEHGAVARGVCETDENHFLLSVTERTKIEKDGANARFSEDDGKTWVPISGDTIVSMNMWGLTQSYMKEAQTQFMSFLAQNENLSTGEFYLANVVSKLIADGKARVKVLSSHDRWFGVTYAADKPVVVKAIREKTESGLYPDNLWDV